MKFELMPEDDKLKSKARKADSKGHIDASHISVKAAGNPWQGKYDRRAKPRDSGVDFSVPVAANDRSRSQRDRE